MSTINGFGRQEKNANLRFHKFALNENTCLGILLDNTLCQ